MNWIFACIAIIISSTITYLAVRKSQDLNISLEQRNFLMVVFPTIFLLGYNLINGISFAVPLNIFFLLAFVSVAFSFFGDWCSLKSMELAPNPGYSLILSKSYVVLTTFLSYFLFDSEITTKSLIAIGLIVLFSGLIIFSDKKKGAGGQQKTNWLWYTWAAFFAWGFLAIALYWFTNLQGYSPTTILFYVLLFASIVIVVDILRKGMGLKTMVSSKDAAYTTITLAVFSLVLKLAIIFGYNWAPNPGYINAANSASIFLVAIFAALVFKDSLNVKKVVGILGIVGALALLFI